MKYEIKNQLYSINDTLSVNTLVIGTKSKISENSILENLNNTISNIPLLSSKLNEKNNNYYFEKMTKHYSFKVEECQNINSWISNQLNKPLDLFNGEFLRLAIYKEASLIIFAHTLISDSRGLINFAKALLSKDYSYSFKYCENKQAKINFLKKIKANSIKNLKVIENIKQDTNKIKVKKISLNAPLVYSLCAGAGISTLSFFLTVALSLNKTDRKTIKIPYCVKDSDTDVLVNDSYIIKFKRGLEPRLSFYDNAGEIDKQFKSFVKNKPYLVQNEILNLAINELKLNPKKNNDYLKLIHSDIYIDLLPSIDEDDIINTLQFYPSSSYFDNGFGITMVDDKINICSILHDSDSEKFYSDYQKTMNLISKKADSILNEN